MSEQLALNNIEKDLFKVHVNVSVDVKREVGHVKIMYEKTPEDKKFMCASLLILTAARIVRLALSCEQYDILRLYGSYRDYVKRVKYMCSPVSNKYVNIFCIGESNYNYSLDYSGFAFGGMFANDLPIVTVFGFFILFNYIYELLLPYWKNIEFYNRLMMVLDRLMEYYDLDGLSPQRILLMCLSRSIYVAYGIEENDSTEEN